MPSTSAIGAVAQWLSLTGEPTTCYLLSPGGWLPQKSQSGAENLEASWRAVCPQSLMETGNTAAAAR